MFDKTHIANLNSTNSYLFWGVRAGCSLQSFCEGAKRISISIPNAKSAYHSKWCNADRV